MVLQAQNDDDEDDDEVDEAELAAAEKRRKLAEKPLSSGTAVAAAGRSLGLVGDDVAMMMVLLKRLEGYPMDLPTLSTSGVAKAIKPLRKHANAEVA